MLVVLNGDGSDSNEEDSSDEIDEELQDGEVGAQQVAHQHRRHDDGVPVYKTQCMNLYRVVYSTVGRLKHMLCNDVQ
jgi:hypothetical protein